MSPAPQEASATRGGVDSPEPTRKPRYRRVFVAYDQLGRPHFGPSRELADAEAARVKPTRKKRKNPRSRRRNFADPGLDRGHGVG